MLLEGTNNQAQEEFLAMSPGTLRKLELGTGSCIGWSPKESEAKK